jgi:hypothetical protein
VAVCFKRAGPAKLIQVGVSRHNIIRTNRRLLPLGTLCYAREGGSSPPNRYGCINYARVGILSARLDTPCYATMEGDPPPNRYCILETTHTGRKQRTCRRSAYRCSSRQRLLFNERRVQIVIHHIVIFI